MIFLFLHKQWIQCISNVSEIGIFLFGIHLKRVNILYVINEYERNVAIDVITFPFAIWLHDRRDAIW